MYIKVTKKMAGMLSRRARDARRNMRIEYREDGVEHYRAFVNYDVFSAEDHGDYDWEKSIFRYIAVIYPGEFYAPNNYLTTCDLIRLYREIEHDGLTFDEFADHVLDAMEI